MSKIPEVLNIKAVLPEVIYNKARGTLTVGNVNYSDAWGAEQHRKEGLARLAVADYLDNLKPKLPTEPGSVILASKIKDWEIGKDGVYLVLPHGKWWASLDGLNTSIDPQDIGEWVPVKLVPQIDAP